MDARRKASTNENSLVCRTTNAIKFSSKRSIKKRKALSNAGDASSKIELGGNGTTGLPVEDSKCRNH